MTWTAKALALCQEYDMIPEGGTVLCAVSGGADSICLLHWLNRLRRVRPFSLHAVHYNHNLRGEESHRDEAFVRRFVSELCSAAAVPGPEGEGLLPPVALTVGSGDVAAQARAWGKGIEETARAMRYAFLQETAQTLGADVIATAHTADDNAETLLLHLARGSALRGLTGIPPRRGNIVRPLLTTTRREIEDYLRLHALPHVEDSTNGDDAYSRNRVRLRVIPELEELNAQLIRNMGETIACLRSDEEYLTAQAERLRPHIRVTAEGLRIEAALLAEHPDPIALRFARLLLEEMGQEDCSAAHLKALIALCKSGDPSARSDLPDGLIAQRLYGELLLTRQLCVTLSPTPLTEGEICPQGSLWTVYCTACLCPTKQSTPDHFYLSRAKCANLVLRPRQTGDRLTLPGRDGSRTVKKYLIDAKIPLRDRERIPLLADEAGVAALAGFGPDQSRLALPGESAWEIRFIKREKDGTSQ